jgi:acid phosphatase type 7
MNRIAKLMTVVCLLFISTAIKANDTLVKFGQNLPVAPEWSYLGGGTALDAQPWKTLGYVETGWTTLRKSALGYGTNPPVRNTAIPETNTPDGGGTSGARYRTMYFRKIVNIANPGAYISFQIRAKFDDGIVIWVNGSEALRNNIIANPVYNDLAPAAIANNGADIYTATVPTSMFTAGDNIIAVEVHQAAVTSSDLFFDMELIGNDVESLMRGPYLQMGRETAITIRWRTDVASNSRITYGTTFGTYPNIVNDATLTTEHEVTLTGLNPDTKYFYTIGSTTNTLQAGNDNYFTTLPPANTTRKLRFVALGDCGNSSTNQTNTKNALLNYIGSNDIDGVITTGDNAYSSGLDTEFQTGFFDMYKNDLLRNKKLYMTPGNHDYGNSNSNTGVRNNSYYNSFTIPTGGEIGGVASGTEAYYSYNIGDVHFLSLDSYGRENANTTKMYDTTGAQCNWIKNDLAANTKRWTVVYFHHPPYTKTSHTSDTEGDLIDIREKFIRILERYGVDMVICGHSHGYERSYLLKNYYKATAAAPTLLDADFNAALHTATGNTQNAKYDGTTNSCAYTYNSGQFNHGSVYMVVGSSGQLGGTTGGYPHDAMYYSNVTNGGCLYFEVDSNRLDAKFLSYSGTGAGVTPVVRDQFTVFKDVRKKQTFSVAPNTPLTLTASWRGNYTWPNNGSVTTRSVTIPNDVEGTFTYYVNDATADLCVQDTFIVTVSGVLNASLTSFTAAKADDKVMLNWVSSQETGRTTTLLKNLIMVPHLVI